MTRLVTVCFAFVFCATFAVFAAAQAPSRAAARRTMDPVGTLNLEAETLPSSEILPVGDIAASIGEFDASELMFGAAKVRDRQLAKIMPGNWFRYGQIDGRHQGRGMPLEGTSWLRRPIHIGWFIGGLIGDDLIEREVDQNGDIFGGYRIGLDVDHYWGGEIRIGFAHLDLVDNQIPINNRTSEDWFWDLHVAYYPWGDSAWRPYAALGLGLTSYRFEDHLGNDIVETLASVPVTIGVKYRFKNWLAVRFDLADNIAIGGARIEKMHNFSFTAGVEIHLGNRRRGYYPW
jgi:hypothetical protein